MDQHLFPSFQCSQRFLNGTWSLSRVSSVFFRFWWQIEIAKKHDFGENTVSTKSSVNIGRGTESIQTFFVEVGKHLRYAHCWKEMIRTALKNLCSSNSWKHQRDERDQRKRIATSARKTTFWTTLRKLAVIIHLRKIVPSGKSGFYRNHAFMCQEINLRKSHFYENFVFSKARNSGF